VLCIHITHFLQGKVKDEIELIGAFSRSVRTVDQTQICRWPFSLQKNGKNNMK
jgi:hypothetical protein